MTAVSSAEVWEALKSDPAAAEVPAEMLEVIRPFAEALPEILAADLDEPATIKSVTKAKVTFVRYALENDFVKKAAQAQPAEVRQLFGDEGLVEQLQEAMEGLVELWEPLIDEVDEILADQGLTEEEAMRSPNAGLSEESLRLYDNGQLTIGELVRVQPMLIVKND